MGLLRAAAVAAWPLSYALGGGAILYMSMRKGGVASCSKMCCRHSGTCFTAPSSFFISGKQYILWGFVLYALDIVPRGLQDGRRGPPIYFKYKLFTGTLYGQAYGMERREIATVAVSSR